MYKRQASAALAVSDIPFGGPISEVRVARVDGEFVINPTSVSYTHLDVYKRQEYSERILLSSGSYIVEAIGTDGVARRATLVVK